MLNKKGALVKSNMTSRICKVDNNYCFNYQLDNDADRPQRFYGSIPGKFVPSSNIIDTLEGIKVNLCI